MFKFLADEDIPVKLIKTLSLWGHDAVRVDPSSTDMTNARRAKEEGRILITLDKDFTNLSLFPPSEFNIIHIGIHPPYADPIIEALRKLLSTCPPDKLKGLIILTEKGNLRIV